MAQHDYIIANQSGASFRADLNNGLAAAVSQNSGAAEPSTTYAYMTWADTTTGLFKLRNGANSAWIPLCKLDGTGFSVANGTAAAPSIFFRDSGTDTGIYSSGTDAVDLATAGVRRVGVSSAGDVTIYGQGDLRFADNDSSNYVGLQAPSTVSSNVLFTLPGADGTARQSLVTDGAAALSFANRSEAVLATSVAATGLASATFTGIPSWAKQITVMCYAVSVTDSNPVVLQVGSGALSGGGYTAQMWTSSGGQGVVTTAIPLFTQANTNILTGTVVLTKLQDHIWMANGQFGYYSVTSGGWHTTGFTPSLSGPLDRVAVLPASGGSFDNGLINIFYEG